MGCCNHAVARPDEQKAREFFRNGVEQHVLDHDDEVRNPLGLVA